MRVLLAAPFLIGSWFGSGQPDDQGAMWLIHHSADGAFRVQFRTCVRGRDVDEIETGRWSLTGDVETLRVMTVNGQRVSQSDTYKILAHGADRQTYRFLGTGFVYVSKRVADDFALPSCEMVS